MLFVTVALIKPTLWKVFIRVGCTPKVAVIYQMYTLRIICKRTLSCDGDGPGEVRRLVDNVAWY